MTLSCYRCSDWPCTCRDGITLIHGDSLEVLPQLVGLGVDHVVTDPPYNVGFGYDSYNDRQPPEIYLSRLNDVFILCGLAGAEHFLWFWQGSRLANGEARACLPPAFRIHHVGAWYKKEFAGDMWMGGHPAFSWEPIIWATRLESVKFGGPRGGHLGRDCLVGNSSRHDRDAVGHPCPKTYSVVKAAMAWIIGECVLDPFAGAGTMLKAAKHLGRRAIGIELSESYCEIAANRLRQEVLAFTD